MTKTFNIAVIPGDGIGTEVVAEGVKILKQIEALTRKIKSEPSMGKKQALAEQRYRLKQLLK